MEQGRQIVFLVLLAVVSALLSVSETRSISSLEVSLKNLNVSDMLYYTILWIVVKSLFSIIQLNKYKYSTSYSLEEVRILYLFLLWVFEVVLELNEPVEKAKSVTSSIRSAFRVCFFQRY